MTIQKCAAHNLRYDDTEGACQDCEQSDRYAIQDDVLRVLSEESFPCLSKSAPYDEVREFSVAKGRRAS
jgi:hypothetical protein